MFESITYESILKRMLSRIPDTFDKREGSVIYDALAPAAIEMQNMYIALDGILMECFADTASLPYLMRKAEERGLTRYPATNAILKAVATPTTVDIAIGSRFSLNELNYVITEKITDGEYKVQCETAGIVGNSYSGDLIPIDYIADLQTIKISEVLVSGEDAEDEEALRERFFRNASSQPFGGNIEDYREKVLDIVKGGGVKVTRTPNGKGGTVKITFIDSKYGIPSKELVDSVQEAVDPVEHHGEGLGVAPIGHIVTVEGAEKATIDIETNITYKEGWSWEQSETYIKNAVDKYLNELCKGWDDTNETYLIVRVSHIESAILQCEGVDDISGTKLNGTEPTLILNKYQIPVRGTINGNE